MKTYCRAKLFMGIFAIIVMSSQAFIANAQERDYSQVVGCDSIYYSTMDSLVNRYVNDSSEIKVNCKFLVDKYSYVIASQSDQGGSRDYITIVIMEKDKKSRFSAQLNFLPDSIVLQSLLQINGNPKALRAEFHISKLPQILEILNSPLPLWCYFQRTINRPTASLSLRNEVKR